MEAKLRTLMQGSPIAIVMTDKPGLSSRSTSTPKRCSVMPSPICDAIRWMPGWILTAPRLAVMRCALCNSSGRQAEALGVRIKRVDGSFSRAILHLAAVPDAHGEAHCTDSLPAGSHGTRYSCRHPAALCGVSLQRPFRTRLRRSFQAHQSNVLTYHRCQWPRAHVDRACAAGVRVRRRLPPSGGRCISSFRPSDATGFFADLSQAG
jgi:hypothetical protein